MDDPRKEKAASLPFSPGVYIMRGKDGTVIYVGKAKKLRNRVYQYFANRNHPRKVANMVANAADFEVILTDTELEALVLENNLIKKYKPKYNILLKDDKGYPFIRVDEKEEYPRLEVRGKKGKDGARYFGPYGGRGTAFFALRTISEILRLPDCSRKFPRDVGKGRPCIRSEIGLCDAPCSGKMTGEAYRDRIREAEELLSGHDRELVEALTAEMQKAAKQMAFERAAGLRDRIRAIRALEEKQKIIGGNGTKNMDVVGAAVSPGGSGIAILHYYGGALADKEYFSAPAASEEETGDLICEFLTRYYSEDSVPPPTVLAAFGNEELPLIRAHLSHLAGRQVELSVPERGKPRALGVMACQNAYDELSRRAGAERRSGKAVTLLSEMLSLPAPPVRIESYDISNTENLNIVGAMVVMKNGRFSKKDYRHFHVRGMDHPDDVGSVRQILSRRGQDLVDKKPGFEEAPDLILMDGGPEQTAAAKSALSALGLSVPVFGMVKDAHHRTRALCDETGREISLSAPGVFALVGNLQEEVHRVAITFHRKGRDARMTASALDGIPGIGEARKTALLKHFGSVKAIREAKPEELSAIIPRNAAQCVYDHFNERKQEPCE